MNKYLNYLLITLLTGLLSCNTTQDEKRDTSYTLWYDQPATEWQREALPIGNGYMGVMFFGGIEKEQIQFAEGTLWSGGPGTGSDYNFGIKKDAWKYLEEVRK